MCIVMTTIANIKRSLCLGTSDIPLPFEVLSASFVPIIKRRLVIDLCIVSFFLLLVVGLNLILGSESLPSVMLKR
jgi:hypothetical protein